MSLSIPSSTLEKFTTFGDLLRFLRRRAGITQMELATIVGYSDTQISRLEQNQRPPDIPTIEAHFISALGVEDEPRVISRLLDLAANVRREDAPGLGLCPYKGLSYFDEADADLFVGRETLTKKLTERLFSLTTSIQNLHQTRLLAIVGASGSGKSSLVRAGLVPVLRWDKKSADWHIHVLTPTAHPLESLAASLTVENPPVTTTATLMDDLAGDPRSLHLFAKRKLGSDFNTRLLLVVDQFEELFILCRSNAERISFISNLLTAASEPDGPIAVVITLRADFYAHCAKYKKLREALAKNQEYIGAMDQDELRRAIQEPAERGRWEFESGLVDVLLHDVGQEPGALPLLSHALLETWQRRRGRMMTLGGYASSGGVHGAISETAQAVFTDQFTTEQKSIARRIFLRLTELSDDASAVDTRRRATFDELVLKPEDETITRSVLKALADARLIITGQDSAEVAHEALIREWPTLQSWLEENRASLRLHRQMTDSAQEWSAMERTPDLLYRGVRLAQAREWASANDEEMNPLEREFLAASIEVSEREAAEKEAQRQRELEAAHKLAESEKERAEEQTRASGQLRKRALYLSGAFVIAFIMAVTAMFFGAQARNAAINAQTQQRIATSRGLAAEANNILQRGGSAELAALLALRGLEEHYTPQADLALQRAAAAYVDSVLIEAPGGAFFPVMSPDNRYLRFTRNDPDGSGPPIAEVWDLQTMERLWQTSEYIIPGYPYDNRNESADSAAVVAALWDDSELLLLDVETGERVLTFNISSPIITAQLSADGRILVNGVRDGDVHVWDMETGEEIRRFSVGGGGYARDFGHELVVGISPDSRRVVATAAGLTHVWDIESGEELYRFEHEQFGWFFVPQFTNDSRLLLAAVEPAISLWDLTTGEQVRTDLPPGFEGKLSPDGRVYAQGFVGEADQDVVLWEVATGRELHRLTGHSDGARPVGFTDGGRQIVTWGYEGTARVWDVNSGSLLRVLAGHTDAIFDATLSPDKRFLVTTGQDATVRIWNLKTPLREDNQLEVVRHVLQFSPDGRVALTMDPETGEFVLVEANSFKVLRHLGFKADVAAGIAGYGATASPPFSSDGQMVLGSRDSATILVFDVPSGELIAEHANPDGVYRGGIFVPSSRHIFASGERGAYLLDAESGEQLHVFEAADNATFINEIYSGLVGVSSDGRYGALHEKTSNEQHIVYVWDLETGDLVFKSEPHPSDHVTSFAFSEGSRYFAWGGLGNIVYVRDLHSGEEVIRLSHLDSLHGIDFSSDNRFLLTSTGGDGVLLWDLEKGDIVRRFLAGSGQAGFVRFVEEDSFVMYSTLADGRIHRQPISPDGLIESICSRVQRDLTAVERQVYGLDDTPTCPKFARP
jgi:WD40 repeat protein/transcriptional regulator with XRE-family HTH domain